MVFAHPKHRTDRPRALEMLRQRGFGLFIVPTAGAAPLAVQVPFEVLERSETHAELRFHVARANPVWKAIGDGAKCLLVCELADHYISPDWYDNPDEVPTWSYATVHASGTARVDPPEIADNFTNHLAHVDALSQTFEQRLAPKPIWHSSKMTPKKRDALLRGFVVITLHIEVLDGVEKLFDHKTAAVANNAKATLKAQNNDGANALAAIMDRCPAHQP